MRILVVEDEEALADVLARGLRQAGFAVDIALDGEEGLDKALITDYDVVALDRQLPGMHGDDVCRELVKLPNPPRILMLTAAGDVHSRIQGLELGADDYLPKPFVMAEVVARVRALGRRPNTATPPTISIADLVIDPAKRAATRGGKALALTRKEFGVLEALAQTPGRVLRQGAAQPSGEYGGAVRPVLRDPRGRSGARVWRRLCSGGVARRRAKEGRRR